MTKLSLTIATCFHNSTARMEPFFAALLRLETQAVDVDFVLIDNASSDDTATRLAEYAARLASPVAVLKENRPGLMYARCTAAAAARGEYVLFLDDDNEPHADYLTQLARLVDLYPDAALFTGNCVLPPEYPSDLIKRQAHFRMLAVRELNGEFSYSLNTLAPEHFPWGAGFFSRTVALREACEEWSRGSIGIVGRQGSQLTGGEDLWLAHHITRAGGPTVFSDTLIIRHRVGLTRFSADYLARLGFQNGLAHLELVDAVLQLKPQLSHERVGLALLIRILFIALPLHATRYILSRRPEHLNAAAIQMGYTLTLMLRVTPSK